MTGTIKELFGWMARVASPVSWIKEDLRGEATFTPRIEGHKGVRWMWAS